MKKSRKMVILFSIFICADFYEFILTHGVTATLLRLSYYWSKPKNGILRLFFRTWKIPSKKLHYCDIFWSLDFWEHLTLFFRKWGTHSLNFGTFLSLFSRKLGHYIVALIFGAFCPFFLQIWKVVALILFCILGAVCPFFPQMVHNIRMPSSQDPEWSPIHIRIRFCNRLLTEQGII